MFYVHSIITTTQSQGANMTFLFFVVLMTIFVGDVVKAGKLNNVCTRSTTAIYN